VGHGDIATTARTYTHVIGDAEVDYEGGARVTKEFTPRERGILVGQKWAESYEGDPGDLRPTADGVIAADLRKEIEAMLDESDDVETTAFWSGFAHGVRAYLVEQGV
jgi:hypothetical protein